MNAEFRVGVIIKTHGIRGEVKVYPTTDSPMRFGELSEVKMRLGKTVKQLKIEDVKYFKGIVILKFQGIDTMEDAERYKGGELYIPREEGIPLSENEYYVADLLGLTVKTEEGTVLGELRDVIQTGANDVYSISRGEGKKDLLIPAIRQCILSVDLENGQMTVHLLDGLLEL